MNNRKYLKFKADTGSYVYIDIYRVESFEQDGDSLIVHKYSGLWSKILFDASEFKKLLIEYKS